MWVYDIRFSSIWFFSYFFLLILLSAIPISCTAIMHRLFCAILLSIGSALGHPILDSNTIKIRKNFVKWTSFHADFKNISFVEMWGRARGREANFQIEVPLRRCRFFRAFAKKKKNQKFLFQKVHELITDLFVWYSNIQTLELV